MSKSVVIVGGGLVGLSSALFLTEAGAEVTVIDSASLGSGAARGNAGFMCTAIVEPLPAPGAIGNALKSLRDPARALRILPKAIPRMAPWLLTFARNCTASRYRSGRAALAEFNRNSRGDSRTPQHPGGRGHVEPRAPRPLPRRRQGRASLQGPPADGRVRRPHPRSRGRRRRDPTARPRHHGSRARRSRDAGRSLDRPAPVRRLRHRHPQVAQRAVPREHRGHRRMSSGDRVRSLRDVQRLDRRRRVRSCGRRRIAAARPNTSTCDCR